MSKLSKFIEILENLDIEKKIIDNKIVVKNNHNDIIKFDFENKEITHIKSTSVTITEYVDVFFEECALVYFPTQETVDICRYFFSDFVKNEEDTEPFKVGDRVVWSGNVFELDAKVYKNKRWWLKSKKSHEVERVSHALKSCKIYGSDSWYNYRYLKHYKETVFDEMEKYYRPYSKANEDWEGQWIQSKYSKDGYIIRLVYKNTRDEWVICLQSHKEDIDVSLTDLCKDWLMNYRPFGEKII